MFETDLKWLRDTHSVMTASTVIDPIHVATAGVFGGELESWSPEQLFLAAINSSFLSSFLAFANKYDCEIISYKCNCIGEIKRRENHFGFTKINLFPTIMVSTENQRTRAKIALEESQQIQHHRPVNKCGNYLSSCSNYSFQLSIIPLLLYEVICFITKSCDNGGSELDQKDY